MSRATDLLKQDSRLSPAKRALLEKWTRGEVVIEQPTIPRRPTSGPLPLSFAQERLWFIDQLIPDSPAYNIPTTFRIKARLDVAALAQSLNEVVRRHEILRTTFPAVEGQPLQVIAPRMTLPLPVVDLRGCSKSEQEALALQLVAEDKQRPFDLACGSLVRAFLLRLDEAEWIFQLTITHIVYDGWSTALLARELVALYQAFSAGKPSPLPELSIQYADFALWQREWLKGEKLEAQLAYWKEQLEGDLPILELPADRTRPAFQDLRGAGRSFELPLSLSKAIRALSQKEGVTVFMTLLAAFKTLLYRYTGQTDLLVGMPIANRTRVETEPLIGFFVNTLVLRTDLAGDPSFRELVGRVRETTLGAYANQDLPFEWLVGKLHPKRDLSRNPLFQVMFTHQNWSKPAIEPSAGPMADLEIELLETRTRVALFDLWLGIWDEDEKLMGAVEYSTSLFDTATIVRMLAHYQTLLESAVTNPDQKLSDLPLLTQAEQHQLLVQWNDTRTDHTQVSFLPQLVEAQVEQTPDAIAVVFEDRSLSYAELNTRANQLAHYLQKRGVGHETLVAVCMERSLEMVIGLLGILKAGGAYLPIDPRDPPDRILATLDNSQTTVVLTQAHVVKNIPFAWLQNLPDVGRDVVVTCPRPQIENLDMLPIPDRSLVDYSRYNRYHAQGLVKHVINIMATRGCPYHCLYCHKLWPKKHAVRSAQNIFDEVRFHYDHGYTTFSFPDDIFNLDRRNSETFFELVIKNNLKVRMLFPSGLRGDVLTPGYIDLMSEAGTILVALALETASPRLQKLVRKNLNIDKLYENLQYICARHPHIILELFTMFGFPTETEQEVLMTFDFVKSIKWLHFPYLNALKIFPNTDMARLAIEHGVAKEAIQRYSHLAYHQVGDTLPFSKNFARQYQADFMREYFLLPERLQSVIPFQKRVLTGKEITAKYDSYLPGKLDDYPEIVQLIGNDGFYSRDVAPGEVATASPPAAISIKKRSGSADNRLRILLLDLSQLFSQEAAEQVYNPVEAPLGLMYLLTYLNREYGAQIQGKILKSMVDYDSFEELKSLIDDFQPQLIGIRTLSLYKDFFHRAVSLIGQWRPEAPIITGGPYATSEYTTLLADRNVSLVVLGEGELTLSELVGEILKNKGKLPEDDVLERIPGLAFLPRQGERSRVGANMGREVVLLDQIAEMLDHQETGNPERTTHETSLAYVIYTSGSTGQPKGVMNTHRGICNRLLWMQDAYQLTPADRILQKTPYNFDVSVWEFFWPLLAGATLVVAQPEGHKDVLYLSRLIADQHISALHFVPSMLQVFLEEQGLETCSSLKRVICSGEALPFALQERFHARSGAELDNLYGPTEAAIDVTSWPCERKSERPLVPIGRPIANTQVYLLDPCQDPVPLGVPGELHIGGIGLARGYLNRPELTGDKFIPNPFSGEPGARLYKTGDLARYLSDGDIEFLGRLDHQVKLRGVRIELGEIEAVLRQHPTVQDAVVLARNMSHDSDHEQLVAYVIPHSQAQSEAELLAEQVSEWQQVFDRTYGEAAAPQDPTFNLAGWNSSYTGLPLQAEEMREWVEQTVERIRSLHPKRVLEIGCGTGMLLFRLAPFCAQYWGVDFSSAALHYIEQQLAQPQMELSQVRLFQRTADDLGGLPSEAFDAVILSSVVQYFPSIEYLVRVLKAAVRVAAPGGYIFVGDVRSLPLLKAFHTSVELERASSSLTTSQLQRRVQKRMSQEQELVIDPAFFFALEPELPQISRVQVHLKRGRHHNEITRFRYDLVFHVGGEAQSGSDLPWLDWEKDRLSLESFRKMLEERAPEVVGVRNVPNARLQTEVRALALLQDANCPKTVGEVREALQQDGLAGAVDPEDWWALSEALPYAVDVYWLDSGAEGRYEVMLRRCTTHQTAQPLAVAPPPRGTDDRRPWDAFANNPLQSKLSGRFIPELRRFLKEKLPDYMMPSVFVLLDNWPLTPNGKLDRRALPAPLQAMSEMMEDGFVAPRTLVEKMLADTWAQLLNLERVGVNDNFFELGGDSILSIQVVARVRRAGVQLTPQQFFRYQTIAELAAVTGPAQAGEAEATPAVEQPPFSSGRGLDLALAGLDRQQFERLRADIPDMQDAYPLSPYQQEMLFHSLYDPQPGLFVWQRIYSVPASLVDVSAFEQALQRVIARFPTLRTSFVWEGLEPLQIVHQQGRSSVEQQDWRGVSLIEQAARLEACAEADRARGFALDEPSGLRLFVARVNDDVCQVVLTCSYMRVDGWSSGLISQEIFAFYQAFLAGQDVCLPAPPLYSDYIAWLRQQGLADAETFWRQSLEGWTGPTPLVDRAPGNRPSHEKGLARQHLYLSASTSANLQSFARRHRLTLNTLMQAAWALLLSRYTDQEDVLFGIIVSGRPATLPQVDSIAGCFLNALPRRVQVPREKPLLPWLKEVMAQQVELSQYEHTPLRKIREWEGLSDDLPLYESLLVFQSMWKEQARNAHMFYVQIGYPLRVDIFPEPEMALVMSYYRRYFNAEAIARMLEDMQTVLESFIGHPNQRLGVMLDSLGCG